MTSINYSYFFKIELLHKYFVNGVCNDFVITPSALTQVVLKGNRMLAKQYGNMLYGALQVDDAGKAFITPSANLQLTFFLQLNNPLFNNYTNLPFGHTPGKIYYFTNRNENVSNNKNFISRFVAFENAKTYHPGDIAQNGSGVVFECIATCTGIAPSVANSTNWMQIDNNRYLSESDALQWIPSISAYTFSVAQTNAVINVLGFDPTNKTFTNQIISKTISFGQSSTSFKLDLAKLSPGKYRLTINGVTQWIYINDELSSKTVFAVIDIFNDSTLPPAYKLLNGTILNSPLYIINFLNRATIWKYILKSGSLGIITVDSPGSVPNSPPDELPDPHFPPFPANPIVSKSPIPLSETPLDFGLSLSTIDNKSKNPKLDIPCIASGSPHMLTTFSRGSDKYACSEIFLNY